MTDSLASRGIRAVVLDIEGTTTPITFVHELFSYARVHLSEFLHASHNARAVDTVLSQLVAEHQIDRADGQEPPEWNEVDREASIGSLEAYVLWLMDRDRKSPGLKALQGHIWHKGYESGVLRGLVFDDVPVAIARWRAAGLTIAIYSSGSALAQRQLFRSLEAGDLTPLISYYFDTEIGTKRSPESYARIAGTVGLHAGQILFVSDVVEELAAARMAGLEVVLAVRPGNKAQDGASHYRSVQTFDALV